MTLTLSDPGAAAPSSWDAVDLFAGPGGWDVAAGSLGLRVMGVEHHAATCRTRRAAGLATTEGDVRDYGPADFPAPLLIGSPPCQPWSRVGKGEGRAALADVLDAAALMGAREQRSPSDLLDVRTALVLEPLRWVLEAVDAGTPYRWVALEQVPTVAPVWDAVADVLEAEGYGVTTGETHAEVWGVPQARKRTVLLARYGLPAPGLAPATHSRFHTRTPSRLDPGVLPWVSMADALGWGAGLEGAARREAVAAEVAPRVNNQSGTVFDLAWPVDRPAPVIAGRGLVTMPGANANRYNGRTKSRNDGVKVTAAEAGTLQTFPATYPWQGGSVEQFDQIGNAVPPLMARALLAHLRAEGDPVSAAFDAAAAAAATPLMPRPPLRASR